MKRFNTLLAMHVAMIALTLVSTIGCFINKDWVLGCFSATSAICWLIGSICIIKDISK